MKSSILGINIKKFIQISNQQNLLLLRILVDSCACTVIFSFCDCYLYFKKKRETKFLFAAVLFTCGSGTIQNRIVCGIGVRLLYLEVKRRSEQD